jgi:Ser/Thr protein kinase RdoA (MazF antagonist)
VLFHGDDATGIVDFGSARVDSPAADLARLLGDTIQNNDALWHCGVDEYRRFASLTDTEIRLARTLDATGAVLSAATWLEWLLMDRRSFPDSEQVFRRLLHLQQRLKQMTSGELRILLSTAETR